MQPSSSGTFENRLEWTGTGLAGVALKPRNRALTNLFFPCVYEQLVWFVSRERHKLGGIKLNHRWE